LPGRGLVGFVLGCEGMEGTPHNVERRGAAERNSRFKNRGGGVLIVLGDKADTK